MPRIASEGNKRDCNPTSHVHLSMLPESKIVQDGIQTSAERQSASRSPVTRGERLPCLLPAVTYTQWYPWPSNGITECPTAVSCCDSIRTPSSPHVPSLLFCTPPALYLVSIFSTCLLLSSHPCHVSAHPYHHALSIGCRKRHRYHALSPVQTRVERKARSPQTRGALLLALPYT